ncbi:MAG: helix-turn-helix domain-containing protein [Erysipelotrichaceae bacterium]|nr:helix-turn-helix domain-containing protein [Erysipelotrichaceae bacterium]
MIQSVDRALDIMMCVSDNHGKPLTISQIAERTGLNQSTCCHIVETLTERGFLNKVSRSSGYVLGIYSYALARYDSFHRDLLDACSPVLRWLQNKTGYTTLLTNLIDGEKFVLRYFNSPDNPLDEKGKLYRGSLYDTATGRAMLSSMKQKELKAVVDKVGLPSQEEWPGVTSFEQLYEKLLEVAKEPVVKTVDKDEQYYFCKFGVMFIGRKDERFALGLELKKKEAPEEEEIRFIEKNMLLAMKEIRRRIEFEKI